MSVFAWKPDILAGVMRNRALSTRMRYATIAATEFIQYIKPVEGYGKRMGEAVTVPITKNIAEPTSAVLRRGQKIPIDSQALSQTTLTVQQYGRGVEYSEESQILSYYNPEDFIQVSLRKQLKQVINKLGADAFKAASIRFAPTSDAGGTFTTDAGATPSTANNNGTVAHVKTISDYMVKTIHCEPYEGDFYHCLASITFLRGLKDDAEFAMWRQYLEPGMAFYRGEVGAMESVRFSRIAHGNALSEGVGTGSVLGEALFFGEEPVLSATALDPEMRAAIPGNFGLDRAIAWYALLAFGQTFASANDGEAKIIYVTSS
jgi:hypothetical protein